MALGIEESGLGPLLFQSLVIVQPQISQWLSDCTNINDVDKLALINEQDFRKGPFNEQSN